MLLPNKNFTFSCSHCSCANFILTSYSVHASHANFDFSWYSILLLNVVFSFEKDSNSQNHSPSGSQSTWYQKLSHSKFSHFSLSLYNYLENPIKCGAITHSLRITRQQKEQWGWRLVGKGEGELDEILKRWAGNIVRVSSWNSWV